MHQICSLLQGKRTQEQGKILAEALPFFRSCLCCLRSSRKTVSFYFTLVVFFSAICFDFVCVCVCVVVVVVRGGGGGVVLFLCLLLVFCYVSFIVSLVKLSVRHFWCFFPTICK